jgi:hypothetical protein
MYQHLLDQKLKYENKIVVGKNWCYNVEIEVFH